MAWIKKSETFPRGFRQIPSFPRYGISEKGELFSLVTNRTKKSWIDTHGYLCFGLQNSKSKTVIRRAHVLVAEAYLGKRPAGQQVCHVDGIKTNCHISNLRYDTPSGNNFDKAAHGTMVLGERVNTSKLTVEQVMYILKNYRRVHRTKSNAKELGRKFGVTRENIYQIISGKSWKHVSRDAEILACITGEVKNG